MAENTLPYWLAALYLEGIGPRTIFQWLNYFPDIKSLINAPDDELTAKGFTDKHRKILQKIDWRMIESDLTWANSINQHIICFDDKDYPPLLKEIADPPLLLFVKGNKKALSEMQIAVVGSRHATPIGMMNAEKFATALVKRGFVVTSGLAMGIDGESHRSAIRAKGVTIGVAGTGLNHIYPRSHLSLVKDIIENKGAIISEFPLDTHPRAANFPRRNRIISGLSLGVLVVEAALKSGSLITARHALEQGREVFAIPGSIHHPLARGCHDLIRQGAKLVEKAEDIFEELGWIKKEIKENSPSENLNLSPEQNEMLEQIDYEITPLDVILLRSRLTASEVSSILLMLELNGYIQSIPGGYIRKILDSAPSRGTG